MTYILLYSIPMEFPKALETFADLELLKFHSDSEEEQSENSESYYSSSSEAASEEGSEETSTTSSVKSSASSNKDLESLQNYISQNLAPSGGHYSEYATSYISKGFPLLTINCDESDSYVADPPPFSSPVKIKEYELVEKRREALGDSVLTSKLIPRSKSVLKELGTGEQSTERLFQKAQVWCEVNKAHFINSKYPKYHKNSISGKYSEDYQSICKKTRKVEGSSAKGKVFKGKSVSAFEIPLEIVTEANNKPNSVVEKEFEDSKDLKGQLENVFFSAGDCKPLVTEDNVNLKACQPWQFKALRTATHKPKKGGIKAQFKIKRTPYPPKTKEQKIAQLRALLPPPKPFELETDALSGIWAPELMVDDFDITPLNYDSRISTGEKQPEVGISLDVVNDAKEKCKKWLDTIPVSF